MPPSISNAQLLKEIKDIKEILTGNGKVEDGIIFRMRMMEKEFKTHCINSEKKIEAIANGQRIKKDGKILNARTKDLMVVWGIRIILAWLGLDKVIEYLPK